jgi:hypothetical protein
MAPEGFGAEHLRTVRVEHSEPRGSMLRMKGGAVADGKGR